VVREIVAPLLTADGAEVFLLSATASEVRLHLTGKYSGCPGNTLAIRHFIEPAVAAVAPDALVVVTSGAIVPDGAQKL